MARAGPPATAAAPRPPRRRRRAPRRRKAGERRRARAPPARSSRRDYPRGALAGQAARARPDDVTLDSGSSPMRLRAWSPSARGATLRAMKTRAAVAYAAGKPLVIEEVDLDGP